MGTYTRLMTLLLLLVMLGLLQNGRVLLGDDVDVRRVPISIDVARALVGLVADGGTFLCRNQPNTDACRVNK